RLVLIGVNEPVMEHAVEERLVAHGETSARAERVVGSLAHRLHAAADDDLGLSQSNRPSAREDWLKPGAADFVDRYGRSLVGETGRERRLARGRLTDAGLEDVSHVHSVDAGTGEASVGEGGRDGGGAQLRRGERREGAEEGADRRAARADDVDAVGVNGHGRKISLLR